MKLYILLMTLMTVSPQTGEIKQYKQYGNLVYTSLEECVKQGEFKKGLYKVIKEFECFEREVNERD